MAPALSAWLQPREGTRLLLSFILTSFLPHFMLPLLPLRHSSPLCECLVYSFSLPCTLLFFVPLFYFRLPFLHSSLFPTFRVSSCSILECVCVCVCGQGGHRGHAVGLWRGCALHPPALWRHSTVACCCWRTRQRHLTPPRKGRGSQRVQVPSLWTRCCFGCCR